MLKLYIFLSFLISIASCSRYVEIPDDQGNMHTVDLLSDVQPDRKYSPENDVEYFLYTKNNPTEGQRIIKGDIASLVNSNFDIRKPVKISTHGWIGDGNSTSVYLIRDAYLSVMDVNFVGIDWRKGCNGEYVQSTFHVPPTGVSIAEFIDWLVSFGVDLKAMHLTGHSLGGHLVGHIGRNVKSGKIGHITGYDPAGPFWPESSSHLSKSDGEYVEVIHTHSSQLGTLQPLGHNDFYPNGGFVMPGCSVADIRCSHNMCLNYGAESIAMGREGFISTLCLSLDEMLAKNCTGEQTLPMGGVTFRKEFGIFLLSTNDKPPYSRQ